MMVAYTHHGVRRVVQHAENDPELSTASWLERAYLQHPTIATSRHGSCRW